jgi:hypothetical protein
VVGGGHVHVVDALDAVAHVQVALRRAAERHLRGLEGESIDQPTSVIGTSNLYRCLFLFRSSVSESVVGMQ